MNSIRRSDLQSDSLSVSVPFIHSLAFQKSGPRWDLSKLPSPTMVPAPEGLRFFILFALLLSSLFLFLSFNPPSLQVSRPTVPYVSLYHSSPSSFPSCFSLFFLKFSGYQQPIADLNREEVRILSDFQSSVQQCVVCIFLSFTLIAFILCSLFRLNICWRRGKGSAYVIIWNVFDFLWLVLISRWSGFIHLNDMDYDVVCCMSNAS